MTLEEKKKLSDQLADILVHWWWNEDRHTGMFKVADSVQEELPTCRKVVARPQLTISRSLGHQKPTYGAELEDQKLYKKWLTPNEYRPHILNIEIVVAHNARYYHILAVIYSATGLLRNPQQQLSYRLYEVTTRLVNTKTCSGFVWSERIPAQSKRRTDKTFDKHCFTLGVLRAPSNPVAFFHQKNAKTISSG